MNNIKVKITKTITTNENKEFKIGNDIHFYLNRNNKTYDCFGVIKEIEEDTFCIERVELDNMRIADVLTIKYEEVKDGIIHLTDNGYC